MGVDNRWFQESYADIVALFEKAMFQTNVPRTKALVCTPGRLWGWQEEGTYMRQVAG